MENVTSFIGSFCENESGATSIEYGVLIAILGAGLIAGSSGFGARITDLWQGLSTDIGAS